MGRGTAAESARVRAAVLAAYAARPQAAYDDIAAECGVSKSRVSQVLIEAGVNTGRTSGEVAALEARVLGLYHAADGKITQAAISRQVDISHARVGTILRRAGLLSAKAHTAAEVKAAVLAGHAAGKNQSVIAAELGITQTGVSYHLRAAGLQDRDRRGPAAMDAFNRAIWQIVRAARPVSSRFAYYRAIVLKVCEKDEGKSDKNYRMVNDAVNTMREAYDAAHQENGRLTLTDEELETDLLIPWSWVVDDTRTTLEVTSWDSTDHALASIASQMRLDLWATQPVRLEVLVESDSIAGVISSVCASLDRRVTIRVAHGQSSCTPVYNATCDYREWDRAVHVLAVTDMDPSGESIARSVEERLHRYAPESDITVQRLAITAEQVVASADIQAGGHKPNTKDPNLKRYTRDSKRRFARLGHPELADPVQSFETESMPVDELRSMLADAIDSFPRDVEEWNAELARENEARAELRTIARHRDELPWLLEHGGEIPLTTPAEGEDVDTDEGDEE